MTEVAGKVVAITGASSGLGEATARHLAALGAKVVVAARRKERLDRLAAEIEAAGGQAEAIEVDVRNRADVDIMVARALDRFGRLDVLVSNAGLMALAPLSANKVEEWERMVDINIKGVLYGIAAALPVFMEQQSGHFINLASVAGIKVSSPNGTVYSATKFAVRAISEGLRHEAGGRIRTTIISPGAVESELPMGSSDPDAFRSISEFYKRQAIPADSVARAIAYAIEQPANVDINEIVLRPTEQTF